MPGYIQKSPSKVVAPRFQLKSGESSLTEKIPPHLGFTLDASSSMEALADSAITSYNALITEQQKLALDSKFSLSTFDHAVHSLYTAIPIAQVPLLTHSLYEPAGQTALNDGIADMIRSISKAAPARATRVLIAILTDGMENSSRTSTDNVASMITYRRTTYDWQFIFIGPDEATDYALRIGIPKSNVVSFSTDPIGMVAIMQRLSKSMHRYQLADRRYALALTNG